MGTLGGKGALVTGGSRGIGRAIVKRLAVDGARWCSATCGTRPPRESQVAFLASRSGLIKSGQNLSADGGGLLPLTVGLPS